MGEQSSNAPGTDTLNFGVNAGGRYYICVDCPGYFDLTLLHAAQANDFFQDAITLGGNKGMVDASNFGASNTGDTPTVSSLIPKAGIWYRWVPSISAQMAVSTSFSYLADGSPHDTVLYVFSSTDDTLGNLVELDYDDDGGLGTNSRASFAASAGSVYYIWVGSYSVTGGPIHLEYFPETEPGELAFSINNASVGENQGIYNAVVRRHYAGSPAPSVTITSTNGSATAGADYTGVNTAVSFNAGGVGGSDSSVQKTVPVTLLPDTIQEASESFSIGLSAPTLGATLGTPVTQSITIENSPVSMAAGFPFATLTVKESDGGFYLPVERQSTVGDGSVKIATYNFSTDTAVNNVDYFFTPLTVSIPEGVGRQFIFVGVANDARSNGSRSFYVNLVPTHEGQAVDGSSSVYVTILDDEKLTPSAGRLNAYLSYGPTSGYTSGILDAKVTATGALTGKIILSLGTYPFTGKLNATGFYSFNFGPATAPRTLTLQLVNPYTNTYTVTLGDRDLGHQVTASVIASNYSAVFPCPQAGAYTEADSGNGGTLHQYTTGSLKVDASGTATLTGKVFDGTAFVATGGVDPSGTFSVGVSLYAGQGRVYATGTLPLFNNVGSTCTLEVVRPGRVNQTVELPPVTAIASATFAAYSYTPGARLLSVWNPAGAGRAIFNNAGFMATTTQNINVSPANLVTLNGAIVPSLKLTLATATGLVTGTLVPPGVGTPQPISAVLLQTGATSRGSGFFLNPSTPAALGKLQLLGP